MTSAAPTDDRQAAREALRLARAELELRSDLLAEAIVRADRWYGRRERTLVVFDRHAAETVGRLRASGRIRPSMTWPPAGATADRELMAPDGHGPRASAAAGRRRWRSTRPTLAGIAR